MENQNASATAVAFPAPPSEVSSERNSPLIIIATSGTSGDMLPFLTMGQGLARRGHRVMMVVPRFHETMFRGCGLPCHYLGTREEFQAALDNPDLWDERRGWKVVCKSAVPHLDSLRQLIVQLPGNQACTVLSHPLLLPAAALARAARPDLRIVAAYLAPSNLCSSHDMLAAGSLRLPARTSLAWRRTLWQLVHRFVVDPVILPELNVLRARHGLPLITHFFEHLLKVPDASLGLFPPWFGAVQPDWPQPWLTGQFPQADVSGAPSLSPELVRFLEAGSAPIVFTPGSGHRHAERFFSTALATLGRLGRRGLFVTPHRQQLPQTLPANVLWQAHTPFEQLLPCAAAVVHHGGIGTTAAAMHAGLPQLVVPFAFDQFDNGYRAQRLGLADVLLARKLSVRRMQRKLSALLACPNVARACANAAREMAAVNANAHLLDQLEEALALIRRGA